jgi:hypothetical protein
VGVTVNTFEVVDASNNTNSCSFTVTVSDTEPPVLTPGTIASCYLTPGDAETDALAATGVADNCGIASVTAVANGACDTTVTVTATDIHGNVTMWDYNTRIDGTAPSITATTATQGGDDVANCATNAQAGVVLLTVDASDNCGLVGPPTMTLTNGLNSDVGVYVNESPSGTYNYSWTVTTNTANGTWNVTVTASDLCQTDIATLDICVNKSQVSGLVQLEGFTGTAVGHARDVTFVATTNGTVLKTWTLTLTNVSGDTFGYLLTDVPEDITGLSAKTDWNLREKLPVTLDGNGQGTADFVADAVPGWDDLTDHYLRGADIEHSALSFNVVNLPDYSTLAASWLGTNPVADITGDGVVNAFDYSILAVNYFETGDDE